MEGFWRNRQVLVTGGCGFIGSHLVEALLAAEAKVRVLGKYNSRSDRGFLTGNEHPELDVYLGDVADPYLCHTLTEGVDTVFHLAALIGIPYSYDAPAQYVQTNVSGTVAMLEAARSASVRRFVHTSTSETYGTAQYTPIDENHPLVGQSPYSATKIAADKLAESYFLSFDLPVATIRPFNTFGPRQSLRAVIPSMMTQALYAEEIVVGSLDPIRDMNYVSDTVAGFLGIASAENTPGGVFNVGSGRSFTIGDIATMVLEVVGVDLPIRQTDERVRPANSEVGELLANFAKAHEAFGYEPSVDLRSGLGHVRDYLADHPPALDPARYRV
ncbi:MAG: GDP-mannose 4,6-dehydratase [Acidimicrobiia bacterium]|nr:GDP-mannose 4,6-dehydratase [Acidimicrobiia bacterium]